MIFNWCRAGFDECFRSILHLWFRDFDFHRVVLGISVDLWFYHGIKAISVIAFLLRLQYWTHTSRLTVDLFCVIFLDRLTAVSFSPIDPWNSYWCKFLTGIWFRFGWFALIAHPLLLLFLSKALLFAHHLLLVFLASGFASYHFVRNLLTVCLLIYIFRDYNI